MIEEKSADVDAKKSVNTASGFKIYWRLSSYSRRYWPVLAVALVAMAGFAGAETGFAWMMQPLLDGSFVQRDPKIIRMMPFVVLGLFLLRGVCSFISTYALAHVGRHVILGLRRDLFVHLLRLPAGYFDRNSSGQLLSKVIYNVDQVAQAGSQAILVIVRDSLKVVGFIGLMFYLNKELTAMALLVGPVIALIVRVINQRFRKISARIQDSVGDVTQVTEEIIQGQRMIKIFGAQNYEIGQFAKVNEKNIRLNLRRTATSAASNPLIQFIASLPVAGIVYYASSDAVVGHMSPGSFAAFVGAMVGLLSPLRQLTTVNLMLQKGIAAAESIFEILETPAEADSGKKPLGRAQGRLVFDQVSFAYQPDAGNVLHNICLQIEPGETVALVGRSGSGKSTLVSLIPRFYDLSEGQILLDGENVKDYRLVDLRRQVSLVSQEITLFNDTVAANIAYGMIGEVSEAQIIAAAEAAYAWDFIKTMPQGLNTQVGQRGVLLSGGQRQRIAIARALLKNAPILILDEATSALDTESERHIQSALEHLMADRTTLVIAHRLSTVERADRIVVMQDGRIVEHGGHAELLARNGRYAELYRIQFKDVPTLGNQPAVG